MFWKRILSLHSPHLNPQVQASSCLLAASPSAITTGGENHSQLRPNLLTAPSAHQRLARPPHLRTPVHSLLLRTPARPPRLCTPVRPPLLRTPRALPTFVHLRVFTTCVNLRAHAPSLFVYI